MKKTLMICAAVAALSACTYAHPEQSPQLTFANYAPTTLNVQSVDVQEAYTNPNDPEDVSGQFVLAPSEAVKRYASNRFSSGGSPSGSFTIVIEDARVHVRQIAQNNKVLKWADVGTEDEYRTILQLKVILQPDGFNARQSTTIKMDRTLIMPSSVTLKEREEKQTAFLEKLIGDVDARITEAMDQTPAIRR
jgi:hypothetical protein